MFARAKDIAYLYRRAFFADGGWIEILRKIAYFGIFGRELSGIILSGTGLFLCNNYERTGRRKQLDNSIIDFEQSLRLTPEGRFYRANIFYNSAGSLLLSYKHFRIAKNLELAIVQFREGFALLSQNHRQRFVHLSGLASALQERFRRLGSMKDIDDAISRRKDALVCCAAGVTNEVAYCLDNIGCALLLKYESTRDIKDLEEAIKYHREELALLPTPSKYRAECFNNLGRALVAQFIRNSRIQDIDDAIMYHREALSLTIGQTGDRAIYATNLGVALNARYERLGGIEDLEASAALYKEALALTPRGHPHRWLNLNNNAVAHIAMYTKYRNVRDMETAIALHQETLSLLPYGDPHQIVVLNNLAQAQLGRYGRFKDPRDLEEAIANGKEALSLGPRANEHRASVMGTIAVCLKSRYNRFGQMEDLDDTIVYLRQALSLRPPGSLSRPSSLTSLADALNVRFRALVRRQDMDEAIELQREALLACPPGHPGRSACLNVLGETLQGKYTRYGDVEALGESIACSREALSLRPPGHSERAISLHNVANCLKTRFERFQDPADLDEAIVYFRESLSLLPEGSQTRPIVLNNLALILHSRYKRNGAVRDLQELQGYALSAAEGRFFQTDLRLRAALYWANQVGTELHFRSEILVNATELLQHILIMNPDLSKQQNRLLSLSVARDLPGRAAAVAIETGEIEVAVTLLEQSRSILLGNLQRYRSPADELEAVDPVLAQKIHSIGSQLESLSSPSQGEVGGNTPSADLDRNLNTQRALLQEWDETVAAIRLLPGFEDFLSAPSFQKLQVAARDGPIILLTTSERRSDAIVIFATGPPKHIPFPDVKSDELAYYNYMLSSSRLENGHKEEFVLLTVVRYLWTHAVSKIVDCLKEAGIAKGSRVWWCPTSDFCLLPVHAAGLYERTLGTSFPDLYVSSYTSTISALLKAKTSREPSVNHSLLFVGHSGGSLENVEVELASVREGSDIEVKALLESEAQQASVLDHLQRYPWVHLSCHGHIVTKSPLESFFQLDKDETQGRVTVQDLISANLPNAELAFLSACHSAGGGEAVPDENLHLAAALQFCGFRGVVGTLWEMYDDEGPAITRDFYKKLMKAGGRYTDAASALHFAIRQCRKRRVGIERWAMFVHFGA